MPRRPLPLPYGEAAAVFSGVPPPNMLLKLLSSPRPGVPEDDVDGEAPAPPASLVSPPVRCRWGVPRCCWYACDAADGGD